MGVLALGFSQLLSGAMKGQKHVQNAVDFDILKTSLNQVFSTKACDGALYTGAANTTFTFPPGLTPGTDLANPASFPDGIPVDEVRHGISRIARRNDTLSGGLKITSLALTSAIFDGDQAVGGVNYKALAARFRVKATKLGSSIGSTELEHNLSVRLLANASDGKVEKCGNATTGMTCFELEDIPAATTRANRGFSTPHGLPGIPRIMEWSMKALVANNGYDAGDQVSTDSFRFPGTNPTPIMTFWRNATHVGVAWRDVYYPTFNHKTGNNSDFAVNPSEWALSVRACL